MEQKQKKKGTPPPRYDEAFKADAARMATEQGREPGEVAKDLGICIDTLRSCLKVAGMHADESGQPYHPGTATHPGTGGGNPRHVQAACGER